jgi:LytS/YehU family sensor histidine kinase
MLMNRNTLSHIVNAFPKNRHFYHYLFWLTLYFSMLFDLSGLLNTLSLWQYMFLVTGRVVLIIGLVYHNLLLLLPAFFKDMKPYYWLALLLSLIVFCVLNISFNYSFHLAELSKVSEVSISSLAIYFVVGVRLLFLSAILKLSVDWYDQQTMIHRLEAANLQAEVKLLKSQLNPHFLFNTLNNLQSLIIRKSTKAVTLVEDLAEMMDYMLYDSQKEKVPLVKEIRYIQNYLDLEQLRKYNSAQITFNYNGNLEEYTIAPLLLLPLIENAVKHGINKVEVDGFIAVVLEVNAGVLLLTVKNNIPPKEEITRTGIGIANLLRRLALLYPAQYVFETQKENNIHTAFLKVNLI